MRRIANEEALWMELLAHFFWKDLRAQARKFLPLQSTHEGIPWTALPIPWTALPRTTGALRQLQIAQEVDGLQHLTARQLFMRFCVPSPSVSALLNEGSGFRHRTPWIACTNAHGHVRGMCSLCQDSLVCSLVEREQDRPCCPCVAVRSAYLPLTLFSFSAQRSGQSSLASGTFTSMLSSLQQHFDLSVRTAHRLEPMLLASLGVHVAILCLTGLGFRV